MTDQLLDAAILFTPSLHGCFVFKLRVIIFFILYNETKQGNSPIMILCCCFATSNIWSF